MNCKYILLGLFFIIGIPAFAQIGELRNNWSIGVNAGAGMTNVSFVPKVKQLTSFAPTGGITVRYISEKYFAMICGTQIEVNFSQRGWKEDLEELEGAYSRTMNYVELPFLVHLAFGRDRGPQFFINLGPQIGLLLNEKEKITGDLPKREQHGKFAEKKFDYGIAGGAGLEIKSRKAGNFLIEGRYYFGLADFYNSRKADYFQRSAHTVISARITYLFDLTR